MPWKTRRVKVVRGGAVATRKNWLLIGALISALTLTIVFTSSYFMGRELSGTREAHP